MQMARATINGRLTSIPASSSDREIRQAAGIKSDRTLIKRDRLGNFVVPRRSKVDVKDGDVFIDAPARIKG